MRLNNTNYMWAFANVTASILVPLLSNIISNKLIVNEERMHNIKRK